MKKLLSLLLALIACQLLYAQNIYTLAGGILPRLKDGDNCPVYRARIYYPFGLATDTTGNLYVADNIDYLIRKITPAGIISSIAGNGSYSFGTANHVLATSTSIYTRQVATDRFGNVYITDLDRPVVRKISPDGIITIVAGDSTNAPGYSGDGGPAIDAKLNLPKGICTDDSGNLYIADVGNYVIRKVNTHGIISTFAGNGTPDFSGDGGPATLAGMEPYSVAIDHRGYLYTGTGARIRRVSLSTRIITTYAGDDTAGYNGDGGLATSAQIDSHEFMAIDKNNNLYFTCELLPMHAVRRIDSSGIITTVAGNDSIGFSGDGGPALNAEFNIPEGVAVDPSGSVLYIADMENSRIRMVLTCSSHIINQPKDTIATVGSKPTFTLGDFGPACYRWQVDTGAGFNDIDTTKLDFWYYRNINNSTLNLPAVALHMNNFKYRCIRYSLTACPDTSTAATLHVIPLAVPTLSGNGSIEISPNPASNQLSITSPEDISSLQVTDVTGKLLIDKKASGQKQSLDISTLPPGMYLLRLNNLYIQKFVKE
jgi:DNA-binding beta-propeller fold protein YncE